VTQKLIESSYTKAAGAFQRFLRTIVFAYIQNNAEIWIL
jgi:hypothetical protein